MSKRRFGNSDYSSDQGMATLVWGPALWHVLHTISFNYPVKPTKQQREDYETFIKSLGKVLPCGACRVNYPINCKKIGGIKKSIFKNRETFSKFIYKLHCSVNKALKKSSHKDCDTYEKVRDRYEHFRARCPKKSSRKRRGSHDGCNKAVGKRKSLKCVINIVKKGSKRKSFNMYKV